MKIIITGSPGTGKTAVAEALAKELKLKAVNEKEFALEKGIGSWDKEENELVVPLDKLEKELNKMLDSAKQGVVIEGHLLCEIKLNADRVVLLRLNPELLEVRLAAKGYSDEKVMDNVFSEGIDYCKKHALRNYPKKKVVEVENRKTVKETTALIIRELGLGGKD